MVKRMRQARGLTWSLRVGIVVASGLCASLSHADSLKDGPVPKGPTVSGLMAPSVLAPVRAVEPKQTAVASVVGESALALRTIPTLSAQVSVGGVTLVPYVAAGFEGGYVTERDRVLHSGPSASLVPSSATAGLKSLIGPHLIPNEVHLGIRFPF